MKSLTVKALILATATLSLAQLGCGSDDKTNFKERVTRVASAGDGHTCNVRFDGTLSCWGWNDHGQLGDGTKADHPEPVDVGNSAVWVDVASGAHHSCSIRNDSWLWCWGWNEHGQLGTGTTDDQYQPLNSDAGERWKSVTAGSTHTCGVRDNGTLWCWGNNHSGQVGNGIIDLNKKSPAPEQIGTDTDWTIAKAGDSHSCALKTDGSLWCWGSNIRGQLGDGTEENRAVPTAISAGSVWTSFDAGYFHTCGVRDDGTIWCWGDNAFGQLGNGTEGTGTEKILPSPIGISTDWKAVALGDYHSCAQRNDDSIWCWGNDAYGQLGNGMQEGVEGTSVPVLIDSDAVTGEGWLDLTAGNDHTCALRDDDTLWCWGRNDYGQVGDGSGSNRHEPVEVKYEE